jgi:3-isopropylmalate dehydrogenase
VINPLAGICALGMLLEMIGEEKAGKAIENSVINIVRKKIKNLAAGKMGYSTEEIGDMVAAGI